MVISIFKFPPRSKNSNFWRRQLVSGNEFQIAHRVNGALVSWPNLKFHREIVKIFLFSPKLWIFWKGKVKVVESWRGKRMSFNFEENSWKFSVNIRFTWLVSPFASPQFLSPLNLCSIFSAVCLSCSVPKIKDLSPVKVELLSHLWCLVIQVQIPVWTVCHRAVEIWRPKSQTPIWPLRIKMT